MLKTYNKIQNCYHLRYHFYQFFLFLLASSVSSAPTSNSTCCSEKKVGDILYTLAESDKEETTNKFGCKDGCVYKADEDPVDRFCFKDGILPVTCLDGNIYSDNFWINIFHIQITRFTGVMRVIVGLPIGGMSFQYVVWFDGMLDIFCF